MRYGPLPRRTLPIQDERKIMVLAERWQRASAAQVDWAEHYKQCVDVVEGRQWDAEALRIMRAQKRPALTINMTARLVRLVMGYQRNNKTDMMVAPSDMGLSEETVAQVLSKVLKQVSENSGLPYVETEVFMDGIIGARGYFDTRLDWSENDFGEIKTIGVDPTTVYLDPDGQDYDLNKCAYTITARRASLDDIHQNYPFATELVRPLINGQTPLSPIVPQLIEGEITPIRGYGNKDDHMWEWWDQFYALMGDFVDPYHKTIRLLDFQYNVIEPKRCFIDLETGDRSVVPEHWGKIEIDKAMYWAESQGNPLVIDIRPVKRVRWTTMAGDIMLYDGWSPYENYTLTGYFPWFRRGYTQGMVHDLIDPQMQINKLESSETEIVTKSGNSGWLVHEDAVDTKQEQNWKQFSSSPGFIGKWKGDREPKRIEPGTIPTGYEALARKRYDNINAIAGLNESALGDLDRVQSGRALDARIRQAVVAIQVYMDNYSRSKWLLGRLILGLIQKHYTEPRIFRITGEDGKLTTLFINSKNFDPMTGQSTATNDVTRGKYNLVIKERPLSATYEAAEFEELMTLLEKMGPNVPMMPFFDLILGASNIKDKPEWIERAQLVLGLSGGAPPAGPGGPPVNAAVPPTQAAALDQRNVVRMPARA